VNPSHRLGGLSRAAKKRLAKLRSRVDHLGFPPTPDEDVAVAWTVIEALNLWSSFLRAYYLSGAIHTRTISGNHVLFNSIGFTNAKSAVKYAIQSVNPKFNKSKISRRDEPAWHDKTNFVSLQQKVGASNLTQIYSAFSSGASFSNYLPSVRNFYAHRCDETFQKAALVGVKLGLSSQPRLRATKIMCSRLPKRPQNILTDWLDDMLNVIDLLCS
jgi:hypothetical protein